MSQGLCSERGRRSPQPTADHSEPTPPHERARQATRRPPPMSRHSRSPRAQSREWAQQTTQSPTLGAGTADHSEPTPQWTGTGDHSEPMPHERAQETTQEPLGSSVSQAKGHHPVTVMLSMETPAPKRQPSPPDVTGNLAPSGKRNKTKQTKGMETTATGKHCSSAWVWQHQPSTAAFQPEGLKSKGFAYWLTASTSVTQRKHPFHWSPSGLETQSLWHCVVVEAWAPALNSPDPNPVCGQLTAPS